MEDKQIGNYKILKKIGAGGMARVYLAVHKDVPNLKVVLKILTNPSLVERFRQEADKLALLDGHPNICRIKHFFNHGDDFVIAMEFIDGVTLDDMIKDNHKIAIDEATRIIAEVLDILEAAHQKGIFHRDIKPGNIMIDKSGNVKIIDFGIAKGKSDPNLTAAGMACGTPAYMAPEQFAPTEDINYALVDIYAAGITLYRIITGELPFKGQNEFAIRDAKLFSEPSKPTSLNSEIPKKLEAVIMKSMRKEPGERYKTAREMKEAILPYFTEQAKSATEKTVSLKTAKSKKKKSKLVPILGAAVLLIIISSLVYKFLPSDNQIDMSGKSDSLKTMIDIGDTTQFIIVDNDSVPVTTAIRAEGTININIEPFGDIYLDKNLIGSKISNRTLTCDTGIHIIKIANSKTVEKLFIDTVDISIGEEIEITYEFHAMEVKPDKPPPTKATGTVIVGSRPREGDIYIDGEYREEKTPYTFILPEGQHIIRIELESGGETRQKTDTVTITKGDTVKVKFDSGM